MARLLHFLGHHLRRRFRITNPKTRRVVKNGGNLLVLRKLPYLKHDELYHNILQYKVDGDEECHNPSEPSTTFCPLLPGQRLNVLDLPSEGHSRSCSEPSDGFTRNPNDRYLNPVPPAPPRPLPEPLLQIPEPHAMPLPSPWAPKSATYPPVGAFLSPNVVRHARSASASPNLPSTPLFTDFKSLKEKLASKKPGSRSRSSSKSQELEIGAPVLISTTNQGLNLIPLPTYQSDSRDAPSVDTPVARAVPTIRKDFSPLGSHPVDPIRDPVFAGHGPIMAKGHSIRRPRSHVPSTIVTSEFKLGHGRNRANSADTRRTQHYLFSNDPWLSSPRLDGGFEKETSGPDPDVPPMPVLQRPTASLAPPSVLERPTSSHGNSCSPNLRHTPLDKELPELPRYLTPAPLFACNSPHTNEVSVEEPLDEHDFEEEEEGYEVLGELIMQYEEKPRSHFSVWSYESTGFSDATSDDEAVHSPTFSSLTSNFSDAGSPQQMSLRFSFAEDAADSQRISTISEDEAITPADDHPTNYLTATPPQLDDLRISTFGNDLFNLDIQHTDTAPRRQAACFGLGFHYSLPEDETDSKLTVTESNIRPEPNVQRESSMSQLNMLVNEFAYLGESVV